jgi:hypothetical protein
MPENPHLYDGSDVQKRQIVAIVADFLPAPQNTKHAPPSAGAKNLELDLQDFDLSEDVGCDPQLKDLTLSKDSESVGPEVGPPQLNPTAAVSSVTIAARKFEEGLISQEEFDKICKTDAAYKAVSAAMSAAKSGLEAGEISKAEFEEILKEQETKCSDIFNEEIGEKGDTDSSSFSGLGGLVGGLFSARGTNSTGQGRHSSESAGSSGSFSSLGLSGIFSRQSLGIGRNVSSLPTISSAQRKFEAGIISKEEFDRLVQCDEAYMINQLSPAGEGPKEASFVSPVISSATRKLEAGIISQEEFDMICKMDVAAGCEMITAVQAPAVVAEDETTRVLHHESKSSEQFHMKSMDVSGNSALGDLEAQVRRGSIPFGSI